jgi:hypothetical protein
MSKTMAISARNQQSRSPTATAPEIAGISGLTPTANAPAVIDAAMPASAILR